LEEARKEIFETTGNKNIVIYEANWINTKEIKRVFSLVKTEIGEINVLINNVALSLVFGDTLSTDEG